MKLQTLYLAYTILTPGMDNPYSSISHSTIIKLLRERFFLWDKFFEKFGSDFSLGLYVSMKKGTGQLSVLGPTVSKRMKIADYSIFLPDEIKDLNNYIDLVFEGVGVILAKFNVSGDEVANIKAKCITELGLT